MNAGAGKSDFSADCLMRDWRGYFGCRPVAEATAARHGGPFPGSTCCGLARRTLDDCAFRQFGGNPGNTGRASIPPARLLMQFNGQGPREII
jgi:hypothetical protein